MLSESTAAYRFGFAKEARMVPVIKPIPVASSPLNKANLVGARTKTEPHISLPFIQSPPQQHAPAPAPVNRDLPTNYGKKNVNTGPKPVQLAPEQMQLQHDWGGAIPPKFQDPLLIKGHNPNLAQQILQKSTHHSLPAGNAWQANQQMRDLFSRQLAQQANVPQGIMPKLSAYFKLASTYKALFL